MFLDFILLSRGRMCQFVTNILIGILRLFQASLDKASALKNNDSALENLRPLAIDRGGQRISSKDGLVMIKILLVNDS